VGRRAGWSGWLGWLGCLAEGWRMLGVDPMARPGPGRLRPVPRRGDVPGETGRRLPLESRSLVEEPAALCGSTIRCVNVYPCGSPVAGTSRPSSCADYSVVEPAAGDEPFSCWMEYARSL
jgi:hypothetical protein